MTNIFFYIYTTVYFFTEILIPIFFQFISSVKHSPCLFLSISLRHTETHINTYLLFTEPFCWTFNGTISYSSVLLRSLSVFSALEIHSILVSCTHIPSEPSPSASWYSSSSSISVSLSNISSPIFWTEQH